MSKQALYPADVMDSIRSFISTGKMNADEIMKAVGIDDVRIVRNMATRMKVVLPRAKMTVEKRDRLAAYCRQHQGKTIKELEKMIRADNQFSDIKLGDNYLYILCADYNIPITYVERKPRPTVTESKFFNASACGNWLV